MLNIENINYREYGKCIKVDNSILELIVPLEFGIRILKLGLRGGKNVFAELPDSIVEIEGDKWHFYGGHRLWLSPETRDTYYPDNYPITYSITEDTLKLLQPIDTWSGVIKQIEIVLSANNIKLTHRVENRKEKSQKLALWAISVMAPGGIEIVPIKGKENGWLHNRNLSLWPYTNMNDPRLNWFEDFLILAQDSKINHPIKLGLSNYEDWGLYLNQGLGFIKKYNHFENAQYPDNNVWYETYACENMLELETLSPITETEPGGFVEHVEEWSIFPTEDIKAIDNSSITMFVNEILEKLNK